MEHHTYEPWLETLVHQDVIAVQLKAVLVLGDDLLYCQ